ncbi:MAG: hypothetical protein K8T90_16070 [Planctomycetes bacterium]|nr:hypothetical protein [Planctomycetota bacterium]
MIALLVPGAAFGALCLAHAEDARFAWLDPRRGSWQFWVIAVAGLAATAAGVMDWNYHRRGRRVVGLRERQVEFAALVFGGVPLFALMAWASTAPDPRRLLVPAVATAVVAAVGVCYDEFTFHGRCSRRETAFHRVLTLGMATAWLAWAHGCFVARLVDA